jgi:transcriptional regulator with XRE-family HTH domain
MRVSCWHTCSMTLKQYLSNHGITQEEFGRLIGVKRLSIARYLNGERLPSPKTAKRIVKATKGAVQLKDLYA